MIRRPPRSTRVRSSAASDVYKRQYIAFQYTGSASSGSNWELDDIIISEGPIVPPPPPGIDTVSIYDIQFNNNTNGASNYVGSQVYTGGIVTAVRDDSSFYLASGSGAWTGVYVYSNDYLPVSYTHLRAHET